MKTNWKILIISGIVLLAIGFFAGRSTSKVVESVRYVQGESVKDTLYIPQLIPNHSEIPKNPVLPMKKDTIYIKGDSIPYAIVMKVDTLQIIRKYITKNSYSKVLFDNNNGRLTVGAEVQYNLLQKIDYSFTPIEKQTITETVRTFTPFVLGTYNSLGYFGIGGGMYYHNVGISAQYLTNFKSPTAYEVGFHIKF